MSRLRAELWNTAGRAAWNLGQGLHTLGLRLCGLSGALDARADSAGYWDHHSTPPFDPAR